MLTIWGRNNAINVKKVLWCLAELDLPYQHILAGKEFGRLHDADYLSLNPNGLIPCLEDPQQQLVLWESHSIIRYLVAQYGQHSLWQADAAQRASSEKWMDWVLSRFSPVFTPLFLGLIRTPVEQRDQAQLDQAQQQCYRLWHIAEQQLANQPFFSGEKLGIADIPLGCCAYTWFALPLDDHGQYPHLQRWYQSLCQRAAFKTQVMLPLT